MSSILLKFTCAATLLVAAPCLAQQPPASTGGPVRQLPSAIATSPEALGSLAAIRSLSNGNVLLNDQAARRVVMLDANLKLVAVVADSTPNTNNAYGGRSGGLLSFRGDSSLFVDPASLSFLVIDPAGKLVRTMAAPRPNEITFMLGGNQSTPGFDARGRLVYRSRLVPRQAPDGTPIFADSAPLLRIDLATRRTDTVTYVRLQKTILTIGRDAQGSVNSMEMLLNNILPVLDEWAVLTDGTIAVVRGQDYHVDFYGSDGTVTRAPKIPYDWERVTEEKKIAILDSTRAFRERARAQAVAVPAGGGAAPAAGRTIETRTTIINGVAAAGPAPGAPSVARPIVLPEVADLPDYRPVFGVAGVRADTDNHIWVRTTAVLLSGGGAIYDVIDNTGKRVDRVQLPVGTTIAGFGPGGVVYLGFRDDAGIHLKKAPSK